MTNFSSRLQQVATNPETFKKLGRGLEREALRHDENHHLSLTPHPESLGKALTHKWVTTDFSESLLEFITPVSNDIDTLLNQLTDIHHFTHSKMGDERLWPMSMPCYVADEDDIPLADYGKSNVGQMKTLYRQGLKYRYGSLMQIISGVHFNFSFPTSFWGSLYGGNTRQAEQSEGYFNLIRNYYRFGWIIPYLFGASPAICPSFVKGNSKKLPFEYIGKTLYLPYATALRLSDLGYTNSEQSALNITFNSLDEYLEGVERAIQAPSDAFDKIGVLVEGVRRQLNSNVLQIENELYAPIRPKRVGLSGERPSESLRRAGVEYIEVRSLDVNPYSPIGISEQQVRFLDLFITWCALADSPPMKAGDSQCWRSNWNHIILEGRKPGLTFSLACDGDKKPLTEWGHNLFAELKQLAVVMDEANASTHYQETCEQLVSWVDSPEKTLSGQILADIRELGGIGAFGEQLSNRHRDTLQQHQYKVYSETEMEDEVVRSREVQAQMESADTVNFDQFLDDYFSYLD